MVNAYYFMALARNADQDRLLLVLIIMHLASVSRVRQAFSKIKYAVVVNFIKVLVRSAEEEKSLPAQTIPQLIPVIHQHQLSFTSPA